MKVDEGPGHANAVRTCPLNNLVASSACGRDLIEPFALLSLSARLPSEDGRIGSGPLLSAACVCG